MFTGLERKETLTDSVMVVLVSLEGGILLGYLYCNLFIFRFDFS